MNRKKILSMALSAMIISSSLFISTAAKADTTYGVAISGQVQNMGWMAPVTNMGEDGGFTTSASNFAGTVHKGFRVEAVKIAGVNLPSGASITYQAQVQNEGWMTPVTTTSDTTVDNAQIAGTVHKSERVETFKMTLNGMPGYAVKYQVQVQNKGWLDPVQTANGTDIANAPISGTVHQSLRMEAVRVEIVKSDTTSAGNVSSSDPSSSGSTDSTSTGSTTTTTADSGDKAVVPTNFQYGGTPINNYSLTNTVNDLLGKTENPSGTFNYYNGGMPSIGDAYDAASAEAKLFSTGEITEQQLIDDTNSGSDINSGGAFTSNGVAYKLLGVYSERTTLNSNDANKIATAAKTLNTQFVPNVPQAQTFDRVYINFAGNTNDIVRVVQYFIPVN